MCYDLPAAAVTKIERYLMESKTLLIMRHAKSSWSNATLSDWERPLNGRGREDAPQMGMLLKEEGLVPDLIISSTAVRARETAELVALGCDYEFEIQLEEDLYHADPDTYYEVVSATPDQIRSVLVVGHNPGIETFLSKVILRWQSMTTANLAQVDLALAEWRSFEEGIRGKLINFWQPKTLSR